MTDQTTPLRDRIAAAVVRLHESGGLYALDAGEDGRIADAVLAVLPAPADQAAVLREAADRLAELRAAEREWLPATGLHQGEQELRRMADETATTETQARRGDAFEAWLKQQRDDCASDRANDPATYDALDDLLDLYRLHADTGTPLGEHVCEARVVGDCECLEQPAAGARQDGAQR
ncbi:hypothetical protein [Streptomyces mutabilis]|uniref:hypothetical protein n=1 Tax=Streptomyces mutabilis TaxID=67332 RepID=UPI00369B0E7A